MGHGTRQAIVAGLVLAGLTAAGARVDAAEPDWATMPYVRHEVFQAVDGSGFGTFNLTQPAKLRGVILNRPSDMLNLRPGADPFMGGQWQMFVAAVDLPDTPADDGTFGGTACYTGQNIGKIVGNHPAGSYSDVQWQAEVDRLEHDPASGRRFQPGDLVEIRARAPGLHFRGKTNVNEAHSNDPQADFDVVLLEAGHGLPAPTIVSLGDLKDGGDAFIFDPTRAAGAEHFQGSAICINDVRFVDTANWRPGGGLTIADDAGHTLPVLLGLGSGFRTYPAPAGRFDVVGILDQEDTVSSDGLMAGYRLWVMDYDGSEFQFVRYARPDFDRDGDVDADDREHLVSCSLGPEVPQTDPLCRDADLDDDGDVDVADFARFQRCLSGADRLADPDCTE